MLTLGNIKNIKKSLTYKMKMKYFSAEISPLVEGHTKNGYIESYIAYCIRDKNTVS